MSVRSKSALLVRAARKLFPHDPEGAQQHLIQAEELAERVQQELSAAIQALRPAALEDLDLAMALQNYARSWSHRVGIAVEVSVQGGRTTPLQIEEALFRVSQEATHSLTRACAMPLPVSSDESALAMPEICHSLVSR